MKTFLIFLSAIFFSLMTSIYAQSVKVHEYVHTGELNTNDQCLGKIGDLKRSVLPKNKFQEQNGKCWKKVTEKKDISKTPLGIEEKDKANNLSDIYAASNIQQQKQIQDHYNSTAILTKLQAQAACTAMGGNGQMIFAMERITGDGMPTCDTLCTQVKSHNKNGHFGTCFNALHIYATAKSFNDFSKGKNPIQGFGVHKYGSGGCSSPQPNYCCCQVVN